MYMYVFYEDISLLSICFMDIIFLVRSFNVNGTFIVFFYFSIIFFLY